MSKMHPLVWVGTAGQIAAVVAALTLGPYTDWTPFIVASGFGASFVALRGLAL